MNMQTPFKFLDSYTKDDKDIFFGREREIEELYQKVFESKTLLIYGVSGTGKTSLINCGLANKFQDSDWLPISIRRGKDIVQSLTDELSAVEGIEEPRKAKSNLSRILKSIRSIYLDHFKPIYLLFDQFEEIFIFGTREERKEFALIIKSIAESQLSCRMMFSIREEYLASLTEMERYIPSMLQNRFRVERMNRQNAISVIEGPCKKFGISVEEGFPDALLDRLGEGGANIELTYLQVYLDKIYRTAQSNPVIASEGRVKQSTEEEKIASPDRNVGIAMTFSVDILNEIGDIKDLLGNFLNEQIAKMENPELANSILKSFVSAKGTKKQLSVAEAAESVQVFNPDAKAQQIRDYIVDFVNLRILRGEDEEGRYELRHDSLAAKIFEKISSDEMELLEVRQFIENSLLNYKTRQILLSPDDFAYIGNREKQLKLSKELNEFVDMSRENIRVKNRTVKRLTFLSAVALIIIILALGKMFFDTNLNNDSIRISYQSITQFKDIEKRLAAACLAYEKNPGANSREALIKAFNYLLINPTGNDKLDSIRNIYVKSIEPAPETIIHTQCTKAHDNIFGYTANYVVIWDNSGSVKHQFKHGKSNILVGKISNDDRFIAIMSNDGVVSVYSVEGHNLYSKKAFFTELNPKQAFGFTSSNLLVISNNSDIEIIDMFGNTLQTLSGHKAQVNALAISKNSRFIASASYDTTVRIWYFNNVKNIYSFYSIIDWHSDTIWSVNFSSNEMCLITVSNDYSIVIGDINKVLIGRYIEKNKFCYAEFLSDDLVIYQKKYWRNDTGVSHSYIADYIFKYYSYLKTQGIYEYQHLSFTEPLRYSAYSTEYRTYLLDIEIRDEDFGNYLLYETNGEKPFFSLDGTRMYNLDGEKINHHFISADSIYHIIK